LATLQITDLLDSLESNYGVLDPAAPTDPYEFLIWWHCGYPASEERCSKGWASLTHEVGIAPTRLISASTAELVAFAKSHPGQVTYASAGAGSTIHLASEFFKRQAGIDLLHVPYKGAAPAMTANIDARVSAALIRQIAA